MKTTAQPARRLLRHALALSALGLLSTGGQALKVDMYAIGNWSGGNCAPGDTGADRAAWPGMVQAWYDQMGAMGHQKTGKFVDGNFTVRRLCDPSVNAGCLDASYVDWPDAAMVAAHGFNSNNGWGALMRNQALGSCASQMGGAGPNMYVGDQRLKFLHASSCLSLNDSYIPQMGASMKKGGSANGLHLFTGFHGYMWIGGGFNGDYADTAFWGHLIPVANAWTNEHYKSNQFDCAAYDPFNWFGTCQDQCPVAMTVGPSGANALNRLRNERYNNSALFGAPANANYYAWRGYQGCDPSGENAFHR